MNVQASWYGVACSCIDSFSVYKGREPILLAHLLTRPAHSIINQVCLYNEKQLTCEAFDSRLRLDLNAPINVCVDIFAYDTNIFRVMDLVLDGMIRAAIQS